MLKWYAETFKLTERQMTTRALRHVKILTAISLLMIPMVTAHVMGVIPAALTLPTKIASLVVGICAFCLCFTKFVNRFWARDKYLDEWERSRKHQSMAFSFQVTLYSIGTAIVFATLGDAFGLVDHIQIPAMSIYAFGIFLAGIFLFSMIVMHLYLLATTTPIDDGDSMPDRLAESEIV